LDANVAVFLTRQKAVPSLCWSPYSATVFACVNEGALEVWDLGQSMYVSLFALLSLFVSSSILPSFLSTVAV